jgi:hypothetical protein
MKAKKTIKAKILRPCKGKEKFLRREYEIIGNAILIGTKRSAIFLIQRLI